jgi:hypothetical protein
MRTLSVILFFLIISSCRQNESNNEIAQNEPIEISNEQVQPIENENISDLENTSDLDSILLDNYAIIFKDTVAFNETDIYGDLAYRIKLTDSISNSHERAIKIQNYLKTKYSDNLTLTDSTLILKLSNGNSISFPFWDDHNQEGFTFEHYYKEINYYLLRVQWVEGNCWLIVNRENGFKKYINGLPYISRQKDKFLSINVDLEAAYSFNGLELYTVTRDSVVKVFTKETSWGPLSIKWINENQFLVKREYYNVDYSKGNIIDYKIGTIVNKTSR